MEFTKIAALVALAITSTGAHAVLDSNGLSIYNDAVTTYGYTSANSTTEWYVSSNGSLADSFFTMGGSKYKQTLDTQFAYLYSGTYLPLDGTVQPSVATFTYHQAPGSLNTTGTSILSTSGDTATVDMSGLTWTWYNEPPISLGAGAWSTGFTNGVGNITCAASSGCAIGSEYTLTYTATIPMGDTYSSYGGVKFYLELHGIAGCTPEGCGSFATPPAIPEASTYGMMLAGLSLVGYMVRRKAVTINNPLPA